jgi:DNA-directed RNA polymerase subunit F
MEDELHEGLDDVRVQIFALKSMVQHLLLHSVVEQMTEEDMDAESAVKHAENFAKMHVPDFDSSEIVDDILALHHEMFEKIEDIIQNDLEFTDVDNNHHAPLPN